LFPNIFGVLSDNPGLILNVILRLDDSTRERWPYLFEEDDVPLHLARRRAFYQIETPESIPIRAVAKT